MGVLFPALAFAAEPTPRLALELQDYAALPVTADNTNDNTRAQLARVNYLRDEPGGRRFFVNDLNGPLYILDKQTKTVHDLPRLQRRRRTAGTVPEIHLRAELRHRSDELHLRSRLRAQRRVLHAAHGGSGRERARRPEGRRRRRSRPDRLHHDARNPDADRGGTDRARSRAHRVEGPEPVEQHVRGDRPRAAATCSTRSRSTRSAR